MKTQIDQIGHVKGDDIMAKKRYHFVEKDKKMNKKQKSRINENHFF